MKVENIERVIQTCIRYVKGMKPSLLPTFIDVIDSENISTRVLEKLEIQFNLLYELQKDY